jgi:uncharacterized Tic20 family protein
MLNLARKEQLVHDGTGNHAVVISLLLVVAVMVVAATAAATTTTMSVSGTVMVTVRLTQLMPPSDYHVHLPRHHRHQCLV